MGLFSPMAYTTLTSSESALIVDALRLLEAHEDINMKTRDLATRMLGKMRVTGLAWEYEA